MGIARRYHDDGPESQSRHQEPKQQIMSKMVHCERHLETVFSALVEIAARYPRIEHKRVDLGLAQPFLDQGSKVPHTGKACQIQR
jgi:hypothetical protein